MSGTTGPIRPTRNSPATEAERLRYGADHRPVDAHGDIQSSPVDDGASGAAGRETIPAPGTLDPYDRGPGEASPRDSALKPKAPPVFQATEDGRLAEPPKRRRK